jgi:hypothetical protein
MIQDAFCAYLTTYETQDKMNPHLEVCGIHESVWACPWAICTSISVASPVTAKSNIFKNIS